MEEYEEMNSRKAKNEIHTKAWIDRENKIGIREKPSIETTYKSVDRWKYKINKNSFCLKEPLGAFLWFI